MSGTSQNTTGRWYDGVTRYQWLVLAIASAGWIFDVFEGQLFAVYKTPAMADVLKIAGNEEIDKETAKKQIEKYSFYALASFLLGGSVGGLVFGIIADRIGRRQTMVVSILFYSVFTGMHYFASTWWHIVALRFLVAMGVGGEWAIAASLVSEVFPKRARAAAGGIFHASSVLGAVFASLCGIYLAELNWRVAFLIGLVPALLIVWIRASLRESEKWTESRKAAATGDSDAAMGSVTELLSDSRWNRRAFLGLALASIGLGTYWGIYAWGPELVREVLSERIEIADDEELESTLLDSLANQSGEPSDAGLENLLRESLAVAEKNEDRESATVLTKALDTVESSELSTDQMQEILRSPIGGSYRGAKGSFVYMVMNFSGGLLGLLLFAPAAARFGRRPAFALYHLGALITAPVTFLFATSYEATLVMLPAMAFFVVGMHAGYAIYFPELFPTRLRATGASFCFNVARIISAGMMLARVPLRELMGLRQAVALMALLFAVGLVIIAISPETKDQELVD